MDLSQHASIVYAYDKLCNLRNSMASVLVLCRHTAYTHIQHHHSLGRERGLKKPVGGQAATIAKCIAHLSIEKKKKKHPPKGRDSTHTSHVRRPAGWATKRTSRQPALRVSSRSVPASRCVTVRAVCTDCTAVHRGTEGRLVVEREKSVCPSEHGGKKVWDHSHTFCQQA